MSKQQYRMCEARVILDDQLWAKLDAVENPAHQLEREFVCQLDDEHVGRHVAFAQDQQGFGDAPRVSWWVWFDDVSREIVPAPGCKATEAWPDDRLNDGQCMLQAGHVGPHRMA
jgi:hypothetical protein